ncbi:hypothetical protein JVT61DRAFT_5561 [Boletus reticuloceps]|uniref:Inner centromere protein ARK-binding domain-containing protein n=1 Tax=Boletus reticuloceps TaxID=495285 RepID=A0A8I2YYQ5_9AGAM|nr:hypothetical protein JVT61DRAFT_5561 [Boletus reticuloceps]
MANTDAKESGIHAWMASVRTSMATDPCRQLFEDQVQTHAFIFLDDYLEHILAGPKQGPMIDLVKTPGRKKNILRRTRAATMAALKVENATLLSLDCDTSTKDVPVNSFHKALLQAKERSTQDALDTSKSPTGSHSASNGSTQRMRGRPKSVQVADIPQVTASIEPELQAAMPLQHYSENPTSESSTPFPTSERGTELSVIAEGDESPERTHAVTLPSFSALTFGQEEKRRTLPPGWTLKPFQPYHDSQGDPSSDEPYPISSPVNSDDPIPLNFPYAAQPSEAGNHTEPLPSRPAINSPKDRERNAFTAPLPVIPISNSIPYTFSVPLNDSSPKALTHKSGVAGFPMLPVPSPLRKSMRMVQEALISSTLPTPAPAPVPLGKRTSWLMKAREAKAMEGTSSIPGTSAAVTSTAFPRVSTAVKRKSGEMLGALAEPDWDREQRKPKVAKSTDVGMMPLITKQTEKTGQLGLPSVQGESIASSSIVAVTSVDHLESHTMNVDEQTTRLNSAGEGFIDLFKRTVEGLGARAGKSMGRSLGGAAVAALVEARAAAEAKVAERNKVDSESSDPEILGGDGLPDQELNWTRTHSDDQFSYVPAPGAEGAERRLSLSDLTTTPPESPPLKGSSGFVKPAGPVFNKPPPPVFMPPGSKQFSITSGHPKEFSFNRPPSQFTLPVAVSLGIPPRLTTPSDGLRSFVQGTSQMASQPSQSGTSSEPIFHNRDGGPTWVSSAQDTQYTIDSEPRERAVHNWPLEEKLAAAEPGWRPFDFSNVDKEDTWSSIPTESPGPTRSLIAERNGDVATLSDDEVETNGEEAEREQETVELSDDERSIAEASELAEGAPNARSASQMSIASDASSSQSRDGFFMQATKLVNSMLGGKKAKPGLKSLQLAAAAAKRQHEEADKKTQRLKDMEARRQTAIAKKAEAEKARLLEEERKSKEEVEKRKREREENTDRRPLKLPTSTKKAEDDASKKRRVASETEKKPESKKPSSKDRKDLVLPAKLIGTPAIKPATQKGARATTTALVSSTAYNATQNALPAPSAKPVMPEAKPFKVVPSSLKKAKAKPQEDDTGDKLPSTMVQSQMAARAKAQMQAAKLPTPEVPSESIELPEINSEYSDSGDEDRVRTFDLPDWAQSPELRQALQMQSTMNPDDIFGEIRPLRMEEMFRTRQSRFRARRVPRIGLGQTG